MSTPKPFTPIEGLDHGAVKVWMWLRQDGKCLLCGEAIDMTIARNRYGAASVEHKKPVSRGGKNGSGNLALTHWECNKRRGRGPWLKQLRPSPDQSGSYYGHGPKQVPTTGNAP